MVQYYSTGVDVAAGGFFPLNNAAYTKGQTTTHGAPATLELNQRGVYMVSADSFATTVVSGTQPDYGAANSIRVGFFETGHIASNGYNVSDITGLTCQTSRICSSSATSGLGVVKNIWEPNHASHSTQLVDYYNNSCKIRTGGKYIY